MKNSNAEHDFWQEHPVGESLIDADRSNLARFFSEYDRYRYATEGHILKELDFLDLNAQKILEIGIGQAADSAQIIRRGGIWSGLDLTEESVRRAKIRFEIEGLTYNDIKVGSATSIPYPDNSFDIVFSHGVIHHIPDIRSVSREIRRVLKPGGKLVVMVYNKNSLNYWLGILFFRRILMMGLYLLSTIQVHRLIKNENLIGHINNAKKLGLFSYIFGKQFIYANTDGPENPYSKVYHLKSLQDDLREFALTSSKSHFLNERMIPVFWFLPRFIKKFLSRRWGWHLWGWFK